jgi:hypothetical protein
LLAELAKQYDTPEKAADFCVSDLRSAGIVKSAVIIDVRAVNNDKEWVMLTTGQWSTLAYGVGGVAPGAPLPALPTGVERRPTTNGADVWYRFTFVTAAGLIRENDGSVLVANVDGFWEPWGYDVDGFGGAPYNGRERFIEELKHEDAQKPPVSQTP